MQLLIHNPLSTKLGRAWLSLWGAFCAHVADEAIFDFLSFYNPVVRWLRGEVPWLPLPLFTFERWLATLFIALSILLAASFWVSGGTRAARVLAMTFAIIMTLNAMGHAIGSLYWGLPMPGIWSSPLLLAGAGYIFYAVYEERRAEPDLRGPGTRPG